MVGKETGEVELERALVGFLKADSLKQAELFLWLNRALIDSVVNAAEVDKVESASAKHEERAKN